MEYVIHKDKLPALFEEIRSDVGNSAYLRALPLEVFLMEFSKLEFPNEFGIEKHDFNLYTFKLESLTSFLNKIVEHSIGNDLQELVKAGLVEAVWNEEEQDFGFKLTSDGEKLIDSKLSGL